MNHAYAADTFEHAGKIFVREMYYDPNMGPPWDEEEGHGPVSEWTTRAKGPGELVLATDGRHCRYYDFAIAAKIALRDGWDAEPYNAGQETKRQQATKAARADFDQLRGWCADRWHWCGVVVRRAGKTESLWGIASDADDYLDVVARELADELLPDDA